MSTHPTQASPTISQSISNDTTIRECSRLRTLLLVSAGFFLLQTSVARSQSPAQSANPPWYRHALVGMEVGPTGAQFGYSDPKDARYCSQFDGAEIVRRCVGAHCEYVVLWARDGDFAYYDSKLLPKAPGLKDRDPLRDAVTEARKHKLPLLTYCVVQQAGHYLAAHPEWEMRDAAGKPIRRFCLNSGYLEAMKQIVAEQLAYGIDGLHIDMLDQGFGPPYGCWCDSCRALFQKQFGSPMPIKASWDQAWDNMLELRYRSSERFEKELYAHIKRINPRASVDFNYHGNPPFSFEVGQRPVQHAGNADFVTGETGVWGFGALTVGLNAEFYRASTPGKPFQVAMQRGVRMYHDQTTRPLTDIRWELLTLLSHGAFVTMVDKTGLTGTLDPVAYRRIGDAFKEAQSLCPQFGHKPVYEVGLYFSSRSRDWLGRDQPAQWMQSFLGAHKACVYEHIPFGVLLDENLSRVSLEQFPVVLLPNVGILSEREVALFTDYVRRGGKLIVTGQTGQFDKFGKPLPGSAVATLIGAKPTRRLDSLDNWMQFGEFNGSVFVRPQHAAAPSSGGAENDDLMLFLVSLDWPFLVKGPATVYQPTTAKPVGDLLKPARTTRQQEGKEGTEWPMSPDLSVGPAVLVNRLGKGTVLTFAGSPDFATAGEHSITETRRLLSQAIQFLNPKPRLRIEAPINVEAIVTDDPASRTLRVHLLGYWAPSQTMPARNRPFVIPAMMEDLPMYRVILKLANPAKHVEAGKPSTSLKHAGDKIEATVDDVHEVLRIGY
jgi:hypothetical protein